MKQKMVIKLLMHCQKCRSKALKIVVGFSGVESAAITGEDKSRIEVIGDGVDVLKLITSLRKKIGFAELLNLSIIGGDKKPDQIQVQEVVQPAGQVCWCGNGLHAHYCEVYDVRQQEPGCTIL